MDAKSSENHPGFPPGQPGFEPVIESLKWYSEGRPRRHGQVRYFNRSFLCANKIRGSICTTARERPVRPHHSDPESSCFFLGHPPTRAITPDSRRCRLAARAFCHDSMTERLTILSCPASPRQNKTLLYSMQ
jgi:hypothetical protein